MDIHDRLNRAIETRGNLSRIAEGSGLSLEAIRKIASGKTLNPGIQTVRRIERALEDIQESKQPTNNRAEGLAGEARGSGPLVPADTTNGLSESESARRGGRGGAEGAHNPASAPSGVFGGDDDDDRRLVEHGCRAPRAAMAGE